MTSGPWLQIADPLDRRLSGVSQLTIAAPEGAKMELAKSLDAADFYVPLSRSNSAPQWEQLKKDNPYGFDIGASSQTVTPE